MNDPLKGRYDLLAYLDTGPTIAPLTARQTTVLTQFLHSLGKNQVALPPETPSENTTPPPTSPPTHEADPR